MPLDGSEFTFEIDETTKLLIAARERIERGWCQKVMRLGGDVCMVGALHPGPYGEATVRLSNAIGTEFIAKWNDAPGRTKDEVLAAFDRAIASV